MWYGWRWDGSRWHRHENPKTVDGSFANMGQCARFLIRVDEEYGIPSHWTAITSGMMPQWTPQPLRRKTARSFVADLEEVG